MSLIWIIGAIFHDVTRQLRMRQKSRNIQGRLVQTYGLEQKAAAEEYPRVDVLMSCYNEEPVLKDAVDSLEKSTYPNYQLVLIDDQSTDGTLGIMNQLKDEYNNIIVIASQRNLGKAKELNTALRSSQADYILCVDADAVFHHQAISRLVAFLQHHPDCAAVTGRPSVLNKGKIITWLQWLEYLMNIDFIKRSQYFFTNHILTVSGVLTMFRRQALLDVNGWDTSAMTEDIDVTWKFYKAGYTCGYEPGALCRIYVPETISGFIKQRIRWARGGVEVTRKRFTYMKNLTMGAHLIGLDALLSYLWIIMVSYSFFRQIAEYIFARNLELRLDIIIVYFAVTLLFYLMAKVVNHDDPLVHIPLLSLLLVPVYFYVYWLYTIVVTLVAFYHAFDHITYAAWGDSDRGLAA